MSIDEFHVTSSTKQQGVSNKIILKLDEGWEWIILLGTDNTL